MKILRKTMILMILIIMQSNVIKAQNDKMYNAIYKLITLNRQVFFSEEFYNKTVIYSISMNVNKFGIIDNVIYSGKDDPDIKYLFDFKTITAGLKANKIDFKSYKNEFLVLMVIYVRGDKDYIKFNNGNQYVENWSSIIKNSRDLEKTGIRQILLTPMYIDSRGKMIKN